MEENKTATSPTEFLIWEYGDIVTDKGTFIFDLDAAKSVMESYELRGNELFMDYDHKGVDPSARAGDGKAAAWYGIKCDHIGLWATDVKWTPCGLISTASGEYRYFSPAFDANDENKITELVNIALTNLPATHNMQPLTNLNNLKKRIYCHGRLFNSMNKTKLAIDPNAKKPDKDDVDQGVDGADKKPAPPATAAAPVAPVAPVASVASVAPTVPATPATTADVNPGTLAPLTQLPPEPVDVLQEQKEHNLAKQRYLAAVKELEVAKKNMLVYDPDFDFIEYEEALNPAPTEAVPATDVTQMPGEDAMIPTEDNDDATLAQQLGLDDKDINDDGTVKDPTKIIDPRTQQEIIPAAQADTPTDQPVTQQEQDNNQDKTKKIIPKGNIEKMSHIILNAIKEITNKTDPSEIAGELKALNAMRVMVTKLQQDNANLIQQLSRFEKEKTDLEVTAVVEEGIRTFKLAPALKEWALSLGRSDLKQLKAYIASAPKMVTSSGITGAYAQKEYAPAGDSALQKMAKKMGVDIEKLTQKIAQTQ